MHLERALVSQLPSMLLNSIAGTHGITSMTHIQCMRWSIEEVSRDLIGLTTMRVILWISTDSTEICMLLGVGEMNTIHIGIQNSEEAHIRNTLNSHNMLKSNHISSLRLPLKNLLNKKVKIRSKKLRDLKMMLQRLRSYPLPQTKLRGKNHLSKRSRPFKERTTRNSTMNMMNIVMIPWLRVHITMLILKKLAVLTHIMMSITIMLMRRGT